MQRGGGGRRGAALSFALKLTQFHKIFRWTATGKIPEFLRRRNGAVHPCEISTKSKKEEEEEEQEEEEEEEDGGRGVRGGEEEIGSLHSEAVKSYDGNKYRAVSQQSKQMTSTTTKTHRGFTVDFAVYGPCAPIVRRC